MTGALGNRRGFTLTELLVVVAIIALLTAIVVPNIAGRITIARMQRAEHDISAMEVALANYHADFGTYPGDVFPTEDINNNGKLDWDDANDDDIVDPDETEDGGVDVDGDGTRDYACQNDGSKYLNGRLDHGDGVINIDDLEWALRTTAKNGPYMESIPLDPWGNKYFYYAPLRRPTGTTGDEDYLYIGPDTMQDEDVDRDGRFDGNKVARDGDPGTEDIGIGQYKTINPNIEAAFFDKWAGSDNGVLDFGDDDNRNGTLEYENVDGTGTLNELEYGNADISPDGLARNIGYYIFSAGRDKIVQSFTGYEDINRNSQLNTSIPNDGLGANPFDEDINTSTTLDTGYEDTGNDGIPGTKDTSEDDGEEGADESFTGPYNDLDLDDTFDIGGDDINSWNQKQSWRDNISYGG